MIGQVSPSLRGRGVTVEGNAIYWLADDHTIMQAALDGSNAVMRYQFADGSIEPPLRSDAGVLYFNYAPSNFHVAVVALTAGDSSAPSVLPGTQLSDPGFVASLDASAGKVIYWRDTGGNTAHPISLYDVATETATDVASSFDAGQAALATSGFAWVEQSVSHADVRACLFGATCDSTTAGSPTFVALATYGDHVYFESRTADNVSTIATCDVTELAARTCTPQLLAQPATELDLLNTRVLRSDAHAVYAGTDPQGAGSLWRIDL
jgi:hypothetical protein